MSGSQSQSQSPPLRRKRRAGEMEQQEVAEEQCTCSSSSSVPSVGRKEKRVPPARQDSARVDLAAMGCHSIGLSIDAPPARGNGGNDGAASSSSSSSSNSDSTDSVHDTAANDGTGNLRQLRRRRRPKPAPAGKRLPPPPASILIIDQESHYVPFEPLEALPLVLPKESFGEGIQGFPQYPSIVYSDGPITTTTLPPSDRPPPPARRPSSSSSSSRPPSRPTLKRSTNQSQNNASAPVSPATSPKRSPRTAHRNLLDSLPLPPTSDSYSPSYGKRSLLVPPTLDHLFRLKKRKLSHRIRSFLLLRPPGLPLIGTDGAADMAHIARAPAWLKNATSELSRESRMAPYEWKWAACEESDDEDELELSRSRAIGQQGDRSIMGDVALQRSLSQSQSQKMRFSESQDVGSEEGDLVRCPTCHQLSPSPLPSPSLEDVVPTSRRPSLSRSPSSFSRRQNQARTKAIPPKPSASKKQRRTRHSIYNWLITPLERAFERQCKLNGPIFPSELETTEPKRTEGEDATEPGRVERSSIMAQVQPHSVQLQLDKIDESSPSSIAADGGSSGRVRQTSAPPSSTSATEAASAHAHGQSEEQSSPPVPPSVLKQQLLSVLRMRLGDAAKAGSGPLRMKKFVVWNAWVRRSNSPSPAQISRGSSPQSDSDDEQEQSRSSGGLSRHSRSPERHHIGQEKSVVHAGGGSESDSEPEPEPDLGSSDEPYSTSGLLHSSDLFLDDDADLDDLLDLSDEEEQDDQPAASSLAPAAPIRTPQVSVEDADYVPSSRGRSSTPETSGSQAYIDPALLIFARRKPDAAAVAAMIAASRSPSPEPEAEAESAGSGQGRGVPLFGGRAVTSPGTEDELYGLQHQYQHSQAMHPLEPSKSLSPTARREEATAHLQLGGNLPVKRSRTEQLPLSPREEEAILPPSPRLRAKALPSLSETAPVDQRSSQNNAERQQQRRRHTVRAN